MQLYMRNMNDATYTRATVVLFKLLAKAKLIYVPSLLFAIPVGVDV